MMRLVSTLWIAAALCSPQTLGDDVQSGTINFDIDVMSILSKAGCNAGTCHGNLNGKGGLKLSLRGQDAEFDYAALVESSRGRRVNLAAPQESLFLRKAVGTTPHRGGIRLDQQSVEYQTLREWIRQGAAGPRKGSGPNSQTPRLVKLSVEPQSAVLFAPEDQVQIKVIAHFVESPDDSAHASTFFERDVTERACYELSNLSASVSSSGQVTREKFGETTLIVRYLDQQVPVPIAFMDSPANFVWQNPIENNFVDRLVDLKLQSLRINPSPICDDSTFVRRAYLDSIGRLPSAEEAKDFVYDQKSNKRMQLVDQLLVKSEFADFWAIKFADILRTEEKVLDPQGVDIFHAWIREAIGKGEPLDQFVHSLLTGTGSTFENPEANYYRANRDPETRGETTARLFLGTRLQCAKCHNHPFDRWTQNDYYQWSSVFSQLAYEVGENKRKDKLDKNEFAGDQIVLVSKQEEVRNPTTKKVAEPKFLGGQELGTGARQNRLEAVANWLTSPENELFVKSQTNFVWYQIMGQGIVEPIDDFRLTNPPSNPALLDALAAHFVESNFDIRQLVRAIMLSRTYQASSTPLPSNAHDNTSYSKALVKRLPAEVLLDMQSDFLGTPVSFAGYPLGIRAVQIPGVQRVRPREKAPQLGDRLLKTFGKPERIIACDCERSNETNLKQVLGLIGEGLNERLASSSRLRELTESSLSDSELIDELYWSALSRAPTDTELSAASELLRDPTIDRATAIQDMAWAIMNAKEFLFRR